MQADALDSLLACLLNDARQDRPTDSKSAMDGQDTQSHDIIHSIAYINGSWSKLGKLKQVEQFTIQAIQIVQTIQAVQTVQNLNNSYKAVRTFYTRKWHKIIHCPAGSYFVPAILRLFSEGKWTDQCVVITFQD